MTDNKNYTDLNNFKNRFKCLQNLSKDEISLLKNKKKQLTYLQGETLFKQGAFAPYVMFIIEGLVKVYLQTGSDKQMNIRLSLPGDFLAFSSIFGENVYNYSAIALKDSTICMIEKESLKQLLLKNPEFAMKITSQNYRNEGNLLEIIKNVTYKQMRGKLASTLIYLSEDVFLKQDVFNYLKRHDIADFASISTESTIKFLKEFEKEGIIKLDGKNIKIEDSKKLIDISTKG